MFLIRGEIPDQKQVVIVDIDEKSLGVLGQWPWSRDKMSKILQNLTDAGVGVIGLDIVFAEADRTSPDIIAKEFNLKGQNLPNYDEILAFTIANTPTILGYQFQVEKSEIKNQSQAPNIPAIIIERNKQLGSDYLIKGYDVIANLPIVQNNSYSSGFFNNVPDESGIIRSVPLVIEYKEQLYPSLALEILRAAMGINRLFVNYSELGVENIQMGDYIIPTDRHGRLVINFRGGEGSFKYLSAVDIYDNNFDSKDIEGNIVLVGTTAAGMHDLRAMPFESVYPGVEIHANVIDNILVGDFISKPSWIDGLEIIGIFILTIVTFFLMTYSAFWMNPILMVLLGSGYFYFSYYLLFTEGILIDLVLPLVVIFVSGLIATFMDYVLEVKNEQEIRKKFASKVSPDVMKDILGQEGELLASQKEISIMFSDVRRFTEISETLKDPKILIELLNEYMTPMTEIIIESKGTIDKFIGDAIMAYWNAPADVKNHQDKALKAALDQIAYLDILNKKIANDPRFFKLKEKLGDDIIKIGIGLNTGPAVVGEMGSENRSDYTALGDSVNLGSRIESLCKHYGAKCMISNFLKDGLHESYLFRFLDLVQVKGKDEPVEIWEVIGYEKDLTAAIEKEINRHNYGIQLYKASMFDEALEVFEELMENQEYSLSKRVYELHVQRCQEYIKYPPENFDGVFRLTIKG